MAKKYTSYISQYNKYLNEYEKELDKYSKYINEYKSYVDTPKSPNYTFSYDKQLTNSIYEGLVNLNSYKQSLNIEEERTLLNRVFDVLNTGNYASAGFVMGLIDDDMTPIQGAVEGLYAGLSGLIPFNKGNSEWEYDYSQVLDKAGWRPESTLGKVARGAVGFAGDVLLDPMTYVSGGVSGLIKGTGKHSVNAALKGVDALGDSAKFVDNIADISKGIGMTQEIAEGIVKNSKVFKSGKFTIDVAEEATKLMTKYNKLLGVNTKSAEVTLSLANAPLGRKIFGKHADKSITLIDSDAMKALGDKTFAPIYGRVRDAVFGGQIGKLFSTNHTLYKLSKTKPEQVYNFIKKSELDIGLSKGKLEFEKVIRKNANLLGELSPSEQKEVMDALQDKTVWHKVKQTVNFIDTKEAARYKKQLEKSKEVAEEKINKLLNYINDNKTKLDSTNLSIEEKKALLSQLEEDYLADLLTIDDKYVSELGKTSDVIKEFIKADELVKTDGYNKLDVVVKDYTTKHTNDWIKVNGIDPNELVKRVRGLDELADIRNADIETKKKLLETFTTEVTIEPMGKSQGFSYSKKYIGDVDDYIKYASEIEKPDNLSKYLFDKIQKQGYYDSKKAPDIKKVIDVFPDWNVTKLDNGYTRITPPIGKRLDAKPVSALTNEIYDTIKGTGKEEIIDDLSTYLFGQPGFIKYSTSNGSLIKVIEHIEEGRSIEETLNFVFDNRELYNGAAREMNSFIASTIGYKNWDEFYNKPMNEMLDQLSDHNKGVKRLTNKQVADLEKEILRLKKLDTKREILKSQFIGKTTLKDVNDYITEFKDNIYQTRVLNDITENVLKRGYSSSDFMEMQRNEWNIESYMDTYKGGTKRQFHKESTIQYKLSSESKNEIYSRLDELIGKKTGEVIKTDKMPLIDKQFKNYDDINKYKKQISTLTNEIKSTTDVNLINVRQRKIEKLTEQISELENANKALEHSIYRNKAVYEETPLRKKCYDGIINTLEGMLNENGQEWELLTQKQKNAMVNNAKRIHNAIQSGKETEHMKELFKVKNDVRKIKANKKINSVIYDNTLPNDLIKFKDGKDTVEGIVVKKFVDGEGNRVMKVMTEGLNKNITIDDFVENMDNPLERIAKEIVNKFDVEKPTIKTLDDIRNKSQLYDEFVSKQEEIRNTLVESVRKHKEAISRTKQDEINNVTKAYREMVYEINVDTLGLEKEAARLKTILDTDHTETFNKLEKEVRKYDRILNNASAFENYVRYSTDFGKDNVDEVIMKYNPHLGEYILRDDLDFNDAVKKTIRTLRDEFITFGEGEVSIGKLTQEQFDNLMYKYVPHIATPEGAEYFSKNKDIVKYMQNFGTDFGYGREFNPFQKSRKITKIPTPDGTGWIENPTISQINEYFKQFTGGKNVFEESLADVYLSRAMKHSELMYDNKYMENMLEIFGEDYVGELKEGFSTVMNYGKLKEYSMNITKFNTSLDISEDISRYIKREDIVQKSLDEAHELIRKNPEKYKGVPLKKISNDILSDYISKYMADTLTDDVRRKFYMDNLENFLGNTGTTGMLDNIATPMAQLDDAKIGGLHEALDDLKYRYSEHIKDKFASFYGVSRKDLKAIGIDDLNTMKMRLFTALDHADSVGDTVDVDRINRILKRFDELDNLSSPQIKQVNNAIVEKANQARKLQIIKDNNDFLSIYDKATHFMKLNQTAVLPSFHARNKLSNMFNNWLEIGYDSVDLDFQKKALNVMKGNITDELFEITAKDGTITKIKWGDLYQAAQDYGAIDSGVFAREIGVGKTSKGLLDNFKVPGKFDPTNTKDFIGYTYGAKVGNIVENHDRFIHFASQVKRGMSFTEAAESVNKFLFNYSDLTMFEQGVMKRIFPYYTWLRKNSQLQLEILLEKPEKYRHISKIIGGIEGMVDESDRIDKRFVNDFAKDWVQMPLYATNPEGRREPILWNPNLPFMDIDRIPDVTRPGDSLKDLFTQTNPLIKVPIEQILNRDIFFDSPIVKDGESQIGKRASHIARQFGVYPVATGLRDKTGLDFGLHLLNSTSGVKLLSYDYDKYKAMKISELSKKKERSKSNPGILDSIKRRLGGY